MVPCDLDIKESVVTILYHGNCGNDRNTGKFGNKAVMTSEITVVINVRSVHAKCPNSTKFECSAAQGLVQNLQV